MEGFIRKVQLTGGTTLSISLPKEWAAEAGLRPGSMVRLIPRSRAMLVLIPEGLRENRRGTELSVKGDASAEMLLRELISLYLAGYDVIKIEFSTPSLQLKLHLKENIRKKLLGMEILNESVTEMVLQCFAQHVELPLKEALKKQADLAASMQRDATAALISGDRELANEVVQRDDEVDKLFYFIGRQLNLAVELPWILQELKIKSAMACLSYSMVTKAIERIGDHASNIANASLSIDERIGEDVAANIARLNNHVKNIFLESVAIFLRRDSKAADALMEKVGKARELYAEALENILTSSMSSRNASLMRTALGDWMRIAEYSADIAEQTIFISLL